MSGPTGTVATCTLGQCDGRGWVAAAGSPQICGCTEGDALRRSRHPICVLCDQAIAPDDMTLTCPRAMGQRRTHEVLNRPRWRPGDPVRPGHSIHVRGCERAADPSVYADPPCTCHAPTPEPQP